MRARPDAGPKPSEVSPARMRSLYKKIEELAGQVDRLFDEALAGLGGLDVLVNNAGIVHFAPLVEFEEARWDRVFEVNVKGYFMATRAVVRHIQSRKGTGSIVNTASVAGITGTPAAIAT